jgi:hypothetical protein
MNIPVNLTPIQKQFVSDPTRFKLVTAGRRSRKTLLSRWIGQAQSMIRPGRYFFGAPIRPQAEDIFWDNIRNDLGPFIKTENKTKLSVTLLNGSCNQVVGLVDAARVEGRPWHGGVITEFDDVGREQWDDHIRPCFSDTMGWAILEGVPEGRCDLYEIILEVCGGAIPATEPMRGAYKQGAGIWKEWAYYSWFSSDVLLPDEIAAARATMDERTFRREYEGSFESMAGRAYYAFGEHNIDSGLLRDPGRPVCVGMDFNVDPMTAVLLHIDRQARRVDQFGEVFLPLSNTWEMADEICRELKVEDGRGISIVPDFSGTARSTKGFESDVSILRRKGFTVYVKPNPKQRDRLAAVNSLMMAANGQVNYKINPRTCKHTITDLNTVGLLPDGRIDKSNEKKGIGHISDALGYPIDYFFPVRMRTIQGV